MAPCHDVNGPCSCNKCGGQLQVKLAKGGNFPGHYYIHCIPCSYHFVFPKADVPRSAAVSPGILAQPQAIICGRLGCKRRGSTQCVRRMCKQCCIAQSMSVAQPPCCLRAHTYEQLSARQRGKLPEPPMALQADEFPLDPVLRTMSLGESYQAPTIPVLPPIPYNSNEKQQYESAIAASLQPTATDLYPSTIDEDRQQYAAAIAASLSLVDGAPSNLATSSSQPPPLSISFSTAGAGPSQPAAPVRSRPSTTPLTKVQTIPFHPLPPNIKKHMSEDWMRPPEDKTKTPKRVRINLDNRFYLVFWHEDEKEPKVRAIHECPVWPKWIFLDAVDIRKELDMHATLVEYYDLRSFQWITCSLSYPHDVKRDGYLLLRLPKTSCLNLEKYVQQATAKAPHLRNNMAGERAGVREKLQQRKIEPPRFLVNWSDDDDEDEVVFVKSRTLKRHAESELDDIRPSQRLRPQPSPSISAFHCETPTPASPFSRSSSITTMSPPPPSMLSVPQDIYVPDGTRWPDGMYAVDMARGFHRIDQGGTGILKARLFNVFGREVPVSTYRDQLRNWRALTQRRRDELIAAGRAPAGLWTHVPKTRK
ncbi:hypothetical protein GALMADRAFT_275227 [Galerina marginata CBS 339.88]|uniref:Uncharacterized protein n=1 Tax=Galerina marginata (strain CBS 339.88) TaxID=685588 RepID=A0A067TLH7_GALM3|nr:hypothetical protein GALMADRAFT_275227 [Galerina marginata CBS 339.88]